MTGLAGCAAKPLHDLAWVEARSENFTVLGPIREQEARRLVRDLEHFRAAVLFVTGQSIPTNPVPLHVYAFGRTGNRRFFERHTAGYFIGTMRANLITLRHSSWADERVIVQHEYVHFLLRNHGVHAYPPWYDEGFSELLSTIERGKRGVDIGRPWRTRIANTHFSSPWIPMSQLMELRSFEGMIDVQIGQFYAESWALVHYLYFGRKDAETRSEITAYLKALQDGASNDEAVESAFGVRASVLGRAVHDYVNDGRYRYITVDLDQFEAIPPAQVRVPSAAEVARALGRLAYAIEAYEDSREDYAAALALSPGDAGSLAGIGNALAARGRWDEADAYFERALAAAPDDALVRLDAGNSFYFRAEGEPDAVRRAELATRAREHYVASWKLDDAIPETYARYGSTYLLEGQETAKGLETLEHAHRLLPSSPEVKLLLARMYVGLGRPEEARTLALVVSTWSHSEERKEEIDELLRTIDAALEASGPAPSEAG